MRCLIADFLIDFKNRYKYLARHCAEYECDKDAPVDFEVVATDADIQQERLHAEGEFSIGYLESVCLYRNLAMRLPERDAFLLHCSAISVKDKGIAFLARSGTGKTTHTLLWKQQFGEEMKIINGDKPIIRFLDETPYVYGTPWAGKERFQINMKAPLTDICFIERAKENKIVRISPEKALKPLMNQVLVPADPIAAVKMLDLLDRLLKSTRLWVIYCDPTIEAAEVASDAIFGND
jgi:hypothetical protein